jgi:hypothetical protein
MINAIFVLIETGCVFTFGLQFGRPGVGASEQMWCLFGWLAASGFLWLWLRDEGD